MFTKRKECCILHEGAIYGRVSQYALHEQFPDTVLADPESMQNTKKYTLFSSLKWQDRSVATVVLMGVVFEAEE